MGLKRGVEMGKPRLSGRRAVFLDRDGVLVRTIVRDGKPYSASSLQEFEILPGVREACARLRESGFLLVVVTNQPDVSRGKLTKADVESMNAFLVDELALDDVLVCYHDDNDMCGCRKPQPGMLLLAAQRWGIDLQRSFMIGDRWKDIEAGQRAGCTTIWVDHGYSEQAPVSPWCRVASLSEAVERIAE
jgi:D-glycero-D-manno-heptose 1,7-bisphosphate phosphatase